MKRLIGIVIPVLISVSVQAQTPAPAAIGTPSPAPVQTPAPKTPDTTKASTPAASVRHSIAYNAPKGLLSGTRIDGKADGGSRGNGGPLPSLYVLTPSGTALTTQAQPSLFWYQSGPTNTQFELTVIEPKNPKPLLKMRVEKAGDGGIHRISLARFKDKVALTPGVLYKWSVALIPDPNNRSQSVIASGTIEHTQPAPEFTAALAATEGVDKAALYASKGYWYDALEVVTEAIDAAPEDKALHRQRADLLDQAGLKLAAAVDRK